MLLKPGVYAFLIVLSNVLKIDSVDNQIKTKRTGSTTHPFLIKLTNLTKPKLMKINVPQR